MSNFTFYILLFLLSLPFIALIVLGILYIIKHVKLRGKIEKQFGMKPYVNLGPLMEYCFFEKNGKLLFSTREGEDFTPLKEIKTLSIQTTPVKFKSNVSNSTIGKAIRGGDSTTEATKYSVNFYIEFTDGLNINFTTYTSEIWKVNMLQKKYNSIKLKQSTHKTV